MSIMKQKYKEQKELGKDEEHRAAAFGKCVSSEDKAGGQ